MHRVEEDEFFFAKFHDDAILKQSIEKRYIYPVASRNISLIVSQDDKTICLTHGAQNTRPLTASQPDAWATISVSSQDGALKLGTTRFFTNRCLRDCLSDWRLSLVCTIELQERTSHKLIKSHHHRYWITGQAKEQRFA